MMIPLFRWIYSRAWLVQAVYLIIGLLLCQAMACVYIAGFNASLVSRSLDASRATPCFVPGIRVLHDALGPSTVFSAAFFLTATVGSAVSLLSLFTIRLIKLRSKTARIGRCLFAAAWLLLMLLLNTNGLNPFPSACLIAIPLLLGMIDRRLSSLGRVMPETRSSAIYRVVLLLILPVWFLLVGSGGFTLIRDRVLLSLPFGESLDRFYYHHALYAGASIQSHRQKSMKTWFAGSLFADSSLKQRIETILALRSHVAVTDPENADLLVRQVDTKLELSVPGRTVLIVSVAEFFNDPDAVLLRFSNDSDRFAGLRLFSYLSLLAAFPLTVCLLLNSGLRLLAELVLPENRAGMASAVILLLTGVFFILPLIPKSPLSLSCSQIRSFLTDEEISNRLAAYRYLSGRADIGRYLDPTIPLKNEHLRDRYWLSRLLSRSEYRQHFEILSDLSDDPVPSIGCSAIRSLGRLNSPAAVRRIHSILNTTTSWYLQDCAYHSLGRGR